MADGSLFESRALVKHCPRCDRDHPIDCFAIKKGRPHGYCRECSKAYQKEWYAKNAELVKARARDWSARNPERKAATDREYRSKNRDRCAANARAWAERNADKRKQSLRASYLRNKEKCDRRSKEWTKANPILVRERSRRLKIARKLACVAWADMALIIEVYKEAERLKRETGIPHEVDHIIPICGRNVCGLHWEGNLQVLPMQENRRKSNKVWHV